jgi:magnesium chelatase family protein
VLQSLREPLEDHVITIVRAEGPLKLPADFQLVMAANGCPCGRLGAVSSSETGCFCTPDEVRRYWKKLGSALLDRIELRVPVNVPSVLVPGGTGEEESAVIARRIKNAVEIQKERFKGSQARRNGRMSPGQIEKFCHLSEKAAEAFRFAAAKLGLSGRACHGILKTARTIADLDGKDSIDTVHVLEAVQHRRFGDDPYDILTAE